MSQFFEDTFLLNVGWQIRSCKVIELNPMRLRLAKPVVFDKDDTFVMLKPESDTIRIVGSGKITNA